MTSPGSSGGTRSRGCGCSAPSPGGDDRPDSDLDLLVELHAHASVADVLGLDDELSGLLGCPVDIVTTTDLDSNPLLRRGVDRDRRPFDCTV
ncbi:hypothetical protein GCM10027445_20200 [Amycolatopsis endophytica]|uniref:Putative nucleotidyltransferase n=1 Tax=Amycolatopsis endophytica TaxID=860233 RepID=A0A853BF22_9PSEU|nr:nucleotidyltransferase domain-containing protein [Amycolatopsis endophytica]NYI93086.1 putative nucleotidyltransferase [Amycolatopsis endophytica]